MKKTFGIALSVFIFCGSFFLQRSFAAEKLNPYLVKKVFLDNKPFQTNFSSPKELIDYLKQNSTSVFKMGLDNKWEIHFLSFFQPVEDPEVYVLVFDITTKGKKEFIQRYNFTGEKGQTTLTAQLTLDSALFCPDHKYLLDLKGYRNDEPVVLGSVEFTLQK